MISQTMSLGHGCRISSYGKNAGLGHSVGNLVLLASIAGIHDRVV